MQHKVKKETSEIVSDVLQESVTFVLKMKKAHITQEQRYEIAAYLKIGKKKVKSQS